MSTLHNTMLARPHRARAMYPVLHSVAQYLPRFAVYPDDTEFEKAAEKEEARPLRRILWERERIPSGRRKTATNDALVSGVMAFSYKDLCWVHNVLVQAARQRTANRLKFYRRVLENTRVLFRRDEIHLRILGIRVRGFWWVGHQQLYALRRAVSNKSLGGTIAEQPMWSVVTNLWSLCDQFTYRKPKVWLDGASRNVWLR